MWIFAFNQPCIKARFQGYASVVLKNRDTPADCGVNGVINRNTFPMVAHNAGIKRNRQRTGGTVVERKIRLAPDTEAAFKAAAEASGNLSMSLYLERLAMQLRSEQGTLPVLSPTLDGTEVSAQNAA